MWFTNCHNFNYATTALFISMGNFGDLPHVPVTRLYWRPKQTAKKENAGTEQP